MIMVVWQTHADASDVREEVATRALASARVAERVIHVHPRHGGYAYAVDGPEVIACYGLRAHEVRRLERTEQLSLAEIWGEVHGPFER